MDFRAKLLAMTALAGTSPLASAQQPGMDSTGATQASRIALAGQQGLCTAFQQMNNSRTGRALVPGGLIVTPSQDSSGFEAGIYPSF